SLVSSGTRVLPQEGDVTRDGDLDKAVLAAVESFGRIDMVIANAGFGVVGSFEALALDDYRRQFETNVFGVIRTVQAVLPELKKSGGRLVLLGSVAGHVALPNASAYAMSKFAVRALASSLYGELRPHGVSVTLISPGFVASEIRQVDNRGGFHADASDPLPAWLLMPSEKAARQIARAAWRRRREEVVTFHGKVIVWVQRLFPWVFALMARRGVKGRPEPA
ncbi:MAG TPA: SDR family NAD(P)-dependent oxidoreductase, partial [Bdellovibrionota bacterium]|nr:SDR family NAD(P)-dependent oxidoreductase [Bdellovibrionota bacterium]